MANAVYPLKKQSNHLNVCLATYDTEPQCGRPLGIRRLNKDQLVVVDTYHGVFTVNVEAGLSLH